jgi:hypothetical protein
VDVPKKFPNYLGLGGQDTSARESVQDTVSKHSFVVDGDISNQTSQIDMQVDMVDSDSRLMDKNDHSATNSNRETQLDQYSTVGAIMPHMTPEQDSPRKNQQDGENVGRSKFAP